MIFRIAKLSDKRSIAKIHLESGKNQPDGFMHRLGLNFLATYYHILLTEKNSIILLAEDESGFIHGFCSGTLSANEHLDAMNKYKVRLAFSVIPVLIKSPLLLKELIKRNKYISSGGRSEKFGVNQGPRCEYWAWRSDSHSPEMAITLFTAWLNIIFELGFNSIRGEVDIINQSVYKIHILLGAKVIDEINLSDGRKRVIIEYKKDELLVV